MILGGSTAALLSLFNCLPPTEYKIDLQLQTNSGPLYKYIPSHINILPAARRFSGFKLKIVKLLKFILTGAAFKAIIANFKLGKLGFASDVIDDFYAKNLSKKNNNHYDIAISFLEGWSNFYLAYNVTANKKIAWIHSTFDNVTKTPHLQLPWMTSVDNIVFVTDACAQAFKKTMPQMSNKTIVIENIIDSLLVRKRSEDLSESDSAFQYYKETNCFKIVTVCRITISVKGLDRIVNCAKILKEKNINFLWYIIGSGPDEQKLKDMITAAGIQDKLIPIGVRYNPYPFIKEADIMCMPSRYEGKPIVITESMILGTVPVVTEYLSAKNQINNGMDGIVVENDDFSITDAILKCINSDSHLKQMKANLQKNDYGNSEYIKTIETILFK